MKTYHMKAMNKSKWISTLVLCLVFASCSHGKYDIDDIEKAYLDGWEKGYKQKESTNMSSAYLEKDWDEAQKKIDASSYTLDLMSNKAKNHE